MEREKEKILVWGRQEKENRKTQIISSDGESKGDKRKTIYFFETMITFWNAQEEKERQKQIDKRSVWGRERKKVTENNLKRNGESEREEEKEEWERREWNSWWCSFSLTLKPWLTTDQTNSVQKNWFDNFFVRWEVCVFSSSSLTNIKFHCQSTSAQFSLSNNATNSTKGKK